ncbi:MAG: hypothetical protein H7146_01095 [Burkholderiaceae bacterium]|nr:hypothetical protein [Microbacteriaceae bacterium]
MLSTSDALMLVLELLTWVGLIPGLILLAIGYARRAFASRFQQTWGIIIPSPAGTSHLWFRWIDLTRDAQSAPVPVDADESLRVGDEVEVWFDPRNSENARLDHPSADGRVLRTIGWVLSGVGAGAGVVQLIVLLVE